MGEEKGASTSTNSSPLSHILLSEPDVDEDPSLPEEWPPHPPEPVSTIKATEILHPQLLKGEQIDKTPAPYQDTIDIERSRPSSPVSAEERTKPVNVGEAVMKYIESGHEPQVRLPSARSRPGSAAGTHEHEVPKDLSAKTSAPKRDTEAEAETEADKSKPETKVTEVKSTLLDSKPEAKNASRKSADKPKASVEIKKDNLMNLNLIRQSKDVKPPEPTEQEREANRQLVSSLMARPKPPVRGQLELEGIGKEGEEGEVPFVELKTAKPIETEKKKTDLSDLASLVQKPKPTKVQKDKVRFTF